MFYMVRLFIYNTEAGDRPDPERTILRGQFNLMIRRLWLGITWPSAIVTLIFGPWMLYLMGSVPAWLWIKMGFVAGLYFYHLSLQVIYRQQKKGIFRYSSGQLRIWNEVATIFLVAIVMLAVVKQNLSWAWGLLGLTFFVILLMSAIRIYKVIRQKKSSR
jgi:protoporphyrinogen IX oxidase